MSAPNRTDCDNVLIRFITVIDLAPYTVHSLIYIIYRRLTCKDVKTIRLHLSMFSSIIDNRFLQVDKLF